MSHLQKTNPAYPSPEKVRDEILQTLKGLVTATICPASALFLAQHGGSQVSAISSVVPISALPRTALLRPRFQAYCGVGEYGWGYLLATFLGAWVFVDFYGEGHVEVLWVVQCVRASMPLSYSLWPLLTWLSRFAPTSLPEFFYHHLGHVYPFFWEHHKAHHVFANPSPFAVIADEVFDQFVSRQIEDAQAENSLSAMDSFVHRSIGVARILLCTHVNLLSLQIRSAPLLFIPILIPINIDMLFVMFALLFYGERLLWARVVPRPGVCVNDG